jgi:hypothetical protein
MNIDRGRRRVAGTLAAAILTAGIVTLPGAAGASGASGAAEARPTASWHYWTPFAAPPGGATMAAAASRPSGELDVAVVNASGVFHNWWNGSWHGWGALGMPPGGATHIAAAGRANNDLDIFVVNGQGLWHRWWAGGRWNGWESLGAPPSAVALEFVAVAAKPTSPFPTAQLDVFGLNGLGEMWFRSWAGGNWSGWQPRGFVITPTTDFVAARRRTQDPVDVLATAGLGTSVSHQWWPGNVTGVPEIELLDFPQGSVQITNLGVAARTDADLDAVAVDRDDWLWLNSVVGDHWTDGGR